MKIKLTEEERKARSIANVRRWEKEHPEKRKEYTKKYYQSEAGKAKKAEQNRRYREKLKLKKLEEIEEEFEYGYDYHEAYQNRLLEEREY